MNVEIFVYCALSFVVTYVFYRVIRSRIKIVPLLWLVNCIVFVVVMGTELLVMWYFHAKQATRNINYDEIGSRYEPYYVPQINAEMK